MTQASRLRWGAVGVIVAAYLWEFRLEAIQQDDAYISYRYALNLAQGHGLVFNLGERVEGFTNLLWTLLIAAGLGAGVSAPAMGHWLSEIFGAASLVLTYCLASALVPARFAWLGVLAPLVLYSSNAFASWTTSGLETPLVIALTAAAAWMSIRRAEWWVSALCIIAVLTRPDGVLLAAVFVSLGAWRRRSSAGRSVAGLASALGPMAVFACCLLLLETWRWLYYGDLLPNTFYAKVGGIPGARGWTYLFTFLRDGPFLLLPGLAAAAWRVPAFRPSGAFILLTFAYVIGIGGDVFVFWRFLVPVLPLMIAGAVAGSAFLLASLPRAGWACAAALPLAAAWSLYVFWPAHWGPADQEYAWRSASFPRSSKRDAAIRHYLFDDEDTVMKHIVAQLRALSPPVHLVACVGIGKIGYFAPDLRILDLVGLVDRHIAHSNRTVPQTFLMPGHQRTDSAYVLARRPDVIQIPVKNFPTWRLPSIVDLWQNPDLDRYYAYDFSINSYVRRH